LHADSPSAEPSEAFPRRGRLDSANPDQRGHEPLASTYGAMAAADGSQMLAADIWPAVRAEPDDVIKA
jgi:hypothetical protein